MSSHPPHSGHLQDWQRDALRQTLRRFLKGRDRIGVYLPDDLEQEAVVQWWKHGARFRDDGPASERTYFVKVVENRLRDIEAETRAKKRQPSSVEISVDTETEDELRLAERIADGRPNTEEQVIAAELTDRTRQWMAALSPRDVETVRVLYGAPSIQAAADRLGIRRTSVYDRIARLRRLAHDAGLAEFLR